MFRETRATTKYKKNENNKNTMNWDWNIRQCVVFFNF
jgi:hypothetical protein